MRHIATTNTKEVIVALKIEDINEIIAFISSARLRYEQIIETDINPEGRKYQIKRATKWWEELYDLRSELK